jgi:hypothetical protein
MRSQWLMGHSLLLIAFWATRAYAQAPASEPEPAVQTSNAAMGSAVSPASVAPATTGVTPAIAPKEGHRPAAAKTGTSDAAAKAQDRIQLDTTQISGNRELPKVMYVVPWRKADLGDMAGRPPNSLLDEALTPVDRDVFRRQNRYYAALESGGDASKSQPGSAAAGGSAPQAKDEK